MSFALLTEFILSEKINSEVKDFHNSPVLVLSGKNWHEGIIGIVASRIKEKYNKPTIIISINKDVAKGSARSIVGFDIGTQIIKCVQLGILNKGGGHKMAAGFTLKKENIPIFRDFLIKSYEKMKLNLSQEINLHLDSTISPTALNEDFFNEINFLAPFGSGNSEPKFLIENIKVVSSNIVGVNHIKSVLIGKNGSTFKGFAWNAKNSPLEPYLNKNYKKPFNIAGKMRLNEWRGEKKVEFIIEDISLS